MEKNENLNSLSNDLLRVLAVMQFKGIDFFVLNEETAYLGSIDEAKEQFNELSEDDKAEGFESYVESNFTEIEEKADDDYIEVDGEEYYSLTDSEADDKFEEYLDNYIEDIILPDVPQHLRNYFDDERWKDDARDDGRGHSLAHYDGHENEETIGDETFYIYRTN